MLIFSFKNINNDMRTICNYARKAGVKAAYMPTANFSACKIITPINTHLIIASTGDKYHWDIKDYIPEYKHMFIDVCNKALNAWEFFGWSAHLVINFGRSGLPYLVMPIERALPLIRKDIPITPQMCQTWNFGNIIQECKKETILS